MSPLVREAASELAARVRSAFGARVLDVRLFGSWARGEANEGSDVDVFVLLAGATRADQRAVIDIAADIFTRRSVDLSPLVMPDDRWAEMLAHERRLARDIQNEGVPL
jgi:predicted nucleotidyltransferase